MDTKIDSGLALSVVSQGAHANECYLLSQHSGSTAPVLLTQHVSVNAGRHHLVTQEQLQTPDSNKRKAREHQKPFLRALGCDFIC